MRYARLTGISFAAVMAMCAAEVLAQAPSETATQFYMRYRTAFDKAKSWSDVAPYMSSKSRKEFEARSADLQKKMFGLVKVLGAVRQPKVVKEEKTADGITLTVDGIEPTDGKKSTGTIKLIVENGAWKLDSESWSS